MSKLTIEQKAQRYDEAIEKLRNFYRDYDTVSRLIDVKEELANLFPELKESEDERIKKKLIDLIYKVYINTRYITCVEHEDMLAWLEKQGEQKPVISNDALREGIAHFGITQHQIDNWLKKYVNVEKQGEQKPTDKVEPKFKNGQWIVWQNKCYKVNYNGCGYELIDQNGLSTSLEYVTVDENAHLWTIKDAKPGDILFHSDSASNGIFIFKELLKYEFSEKVICYCDYDSEDHFCLGEHHTCCWADAKILQPATKEQRDTLMKAMADAGYTFNFEKKELRKIEQVNEVKPKFKYGDRVRNKKSGVTQVLGGCIEDVYEGAFPFRIKEQDDWELVEQKSAWSEEDERIIKQLTSLWSELMIEPTCCRFGLHKDEVIHWLESLKGRVQPQVEWGEWGKKYIASTIKMVEHCSFSSIGGITKAAAITWLKSLGPQTIWKPSDEQMEALLWNVCKEGENQPTLASLYNDLKKLKDYN